MPEEILKQLGILPSIKNTYNWENLLSQQTLPSRETVIKNYDDWKKREVDIYNSEYFPEQIAQDQTVGERIANGVGRLIGTTITKTLEGLGYAVTAPVAGVQAIAGDPRAFETLTTNAWSNFFNNVEEDIKNQLPIYKTKNYLNGNVWQQMGTASFWTDDVIDGLAFMASAMIPGFAATKALSLGSKAIKGYANLAKTFNNALKAEKILGELAITGSNLSKLSKTIDTLGIGLITSGIEAGFEAKDVYDRVLEKTGDRESAAKAAQETYLRNIPALMVSNTIEAGAWQKVFGKVSKPVSGILNVADETIPIGRKLAKFGWEGLKTGFMEGGWEENIQLAISDEATRKYTKEDTKGLVNSWLNNWTTDEGQKNIVLGALLGFIPGGLGGIRQISDANKDENRVRNYLRTNYSTFVGGLKSLYKTEVIDGKEQIYINPKNNKPVYDINKVINALASDVDKGSLNAKLAQALISGNNEMAQHLLMQRLGTWMYGYMNRDNLDALNQDIDLETQSPESPFVLTDQQGNKLDKAATASLMKQEAVKNKKIYDEINDRIIPTMFGTKKVDSTTLQFYEDLKFSLYRETIFQNQLKDGINKIDNEITSIKDTLNEIAGEDQSSSDNSKIKQLNKDKAIINTLLEDSRNNVKILLDKNIQTKELNSRLEIQKDFENNEEKYERIANESRTKKSDSRGANETTTTDRESGQTSEVRNKEEVETLIHSTNERIDTIKKDIKNLTPKEIDKELKWIDNKLKDKDITSNESTVKALYDIKKYISFFIEGQQSSRVPANEESRSESSKVEDDNEANVANPIQEKDNTISSDNLTKLSRNDIINELDEIINLANLNKTINTYLEEDKTVSPERSEYITNRINDLPLTYDDIAGYIQRLAATKNYTASEKAFAIETLINRLEQEGFPVLGFDESYYPTIKDKSFDKAKEENRKVIIRYDQVQTGSDKGAYLNIPYEQFGIEDEDGVISINRRSLDNKVKGYFDILNGNKYPAGTTLTFQIDTELAYVDNEGNDITFFDLNEKEGEKIGEYNLGHVPIKVMDDKGVTLFYVHDIDWITEENVYGIHQDDLTDEEFETQKKLAIEEDRKNLLNIRRNIINKIIIDGETKGKISERSTGKLIDNKTPKRVNKAFPHEEVKITVVRNGIFMLGNTVRFNERVINDDYEGFVPIEGGVYAMLPIKEGGTIKAYKAIDLDTLKLSDFTNKNGNNTYINSIIKVLEEYINNNVNTQLENIGYLTTDFRDILRYISNFIYSYDPVSRKGESLKKILEENNYSSSLFRFSPRMIEFGSSISLPEGVEGSHITNYNKIYYNEKGQIETIETFDGAKPFKYDKNAKGISSDKQTENLNRGKELFLNNLRSHLKNVDFNIDVNKLSDSNSIRLPLLINNNFNTGQTTFAYKNYQSLVKNHTESRFYGINLGSKETPNFTYFVQPVITYSLDSEVKSKERNKRVKPELYYATYNKNSSRKELIENIVKETSSFNEDYSNKVWWNPLTLKERTKLSNQILNEVRSKYPNLNILVDTADNTHLRLKIFEKNDQLGYYNIDALKQELGEELYYPTNQINYALKSVDILLSDRAKQIFDKGNKNKWSLDKILTELAIPKDQKVILLDLGITDREQLALELANTYGYTVEVNTAKEYRNIQIGEKLLGYNKDGSESRAFFITKDGERTDKETFYNIEDAERHFKNYTSNSQHYSNLTVPGGTNYTENEISTPLITPSIKGHAQFSTDKGIGWFRSDVQATNIQKPEEDGAGGLVRRSTATKNRRILEIQSDLFQKGRDTSLLVDTDNLKPINFSTEFSNYTIDERGYIDIKHENGFIEHITLREIGGRQDEDLIKNELRKHKELLGEGRIDNQFLQLLNKDNNWVTFFIKSIIQDSAKKGYERVLFPKGETAAKVEGHELIADRIIAIDKKLDYLRSIDTSGSEFKIDDVYYGIDEEGNYYFAEDVNGKSQITKEQYDTAISKQINQLEDERARYKSEGIEKLAPIEAFYEIKIGNILEKQFGKDNVKTITDEYGNKWREIEIKPERDLKDILLYPKVETSSITSQYVIPELSHSDQSDLVNTIISDYVNKVVNSKDSIDPNTVLDEYYDDIVASRNDNPEIYDIVINNWDKIVNRFNWDLQKVIGKGIITNDDFQDEVDLYGTDNTRNYFDDSSSYKVNLKNRLSAKIRLFLSGIDDLNENYEPIGGFLGYIKTLPFDTVYNKLLDLLCDKLTNYEQKLAILEDKKSTYPFLQSVIDKLKTSDEQIQNQFNIAFNKAYYEFVNSTQFIRYINEEKREHHIVNTSNVNSDYSIIIDNWRSNVTGLGLTISTENNEIFNKDKFNEFGIEFTKQQQKPTIDGTIKLLSGIGIILDKNAIRSLISKYQRLSSLYSRNGVITQLHRNLMDLVNSGIDIDDSNFYSGQNMPLRILSKIQVKFNEDLGSPVSLGIDMSQYWNYGEYRYVIQRFRDIKDRNESLFKKLIKHPFYKYSIWLNEIYDQTTNQFKDNNFIDILDWSVDDGYKAFGIKIGSKVSELNNANLERYMLDLFMNQGQLINKNQDRIIKIHYPNLADGSALFNFTVKGQWVKYNEDGSLSQDTVRMLYNSIVKPELLRIIDFQNGNLKDIRKYDKGASQFLVMSNLNNIDTLKDSDSKFINPYDTNGRLVRPDILNIYHEQVTEFIKDEFTRKKQDWINLGILDSKGKLTYIDDNYLKNIAGSSPRINPSRYAIYDFIVNNLIAIANIYQLFIGDPALYFDENPNKTFININKRLSGDKTPKISVQEKDSEFIFIPLKEKIVNPTNPEINAKDGKGTDSQAYGTFREYIAMQYYQGFVSKNLYNFLNDFIASEVKAKRFNYADKLSKELDKNKELREEYDNMIIQPAKTGFNDLEFNNKSDRKVFLKFSVNYLIPSVTQDFEIDKLRISLEELENKLGKTIIAGAESGIKVGNIEDNTNIWETNSVIDNIDFTDKYLTLSRQGYGVIQENPYDEEKGSISRGTQLDGLLFLNILDQEFSHNGNSISGYELQKLYNNVNHQLFKNEKDRLFTELEVVNNRVNIFKLQEILRKEGLTRGWSLVDIENLTIKDGKFKYPLFFNASNDKIEKLLLSIVDSRVRRFKENGTSSVLVSEEGWNIVDESNKKYNSNVIYTDKFTGELGYNQIIISSYIRDQYGNLIDLFEQDIDGNYKYITKQDNGKVLLNKEISDSLVTKSTSFRIPTSSHNTMEFVEVVGILPDVKNTVIASRDFIFKMGSDFDFDKLYSYFYNNAINKDGKIVSINRENYKDLLRNKYFYKYANDNKNDQIIQLYFDNQSRINTIKDELLTLFKGRKISVGVYKAKLARLKEILNEEKTIKKSQLDELKATLSDYKDYLNDLEESAIDYKIATYFEKQYIAKLQQDSKFLELSNKKQRNIVKEQEALTRETIEKYKDNLREIADLKEVINNLYKDIKEFTDTILPSQVVKDEIFFKKESKYEEYTTKIKILLDERSKLIDRNKEIVKSKEGYYFKNIPNEVLENELQDIRNSILSSENKTIRKQLYTPMSYGKLSDPSIQYNDISKHNPYSQITQRENYVRTQEAVQFGIGIKANDNMFIAAIQHPTKIAKYLVNGVPIKIRFGNVESTDLGDIYTHDGNYKSDVNQYYLQAMVDYSKELLPDRVNSNKYTFDAERALILHGFNEDEIALFLNQEVIREYVHKMSSSLRENFTTRNRVANELSEKYGILSPEDMNKYGSEELSFDKLRELLRNKTVQDYNNYQSAILSKFLNLVKIGKDIREIVSITSLNSKKIGINLMSASIKQDLVKKLYNNEKFENIDHLLGEFKTEDELLNKFDSTIDAKEKGWYLIGTIQDGANLYLKPSTINGFTLTEVLLTNNILWREFYPYNKDIVQKVVNEIIETTTGFEFLSNTEYEKYQQDIFRGLRSYIISGFFKDYEQDEEVSNLRKRLTLTRTHTESHLDNKTGQYSDTLIYDNYSLAHIINKEKKTLSKYAIINKLNIKPKLKGVSLIQFIGSRSQDFNDINVYSSIIDMIENPVELGTWNGIKYNTALIAEDLLKYALLVSNSPLIDFIQYFPPSLLDKIGITSYLENVDFNNEDYYGYDLRPSEDRKISTFGKQFLQHKSNYVKAIDNYADALYNITEDSFYFPELNENNLYLRDFYTNIIKVSTGEISGTPKQFLTLDDELYELSEKVGTNYKYERISKLGLFGLDEYNFDQYNTQSIINRNSSTKIDPDKRVQNSSIRNTVKSTITIGQRIGLEGGFKYKNNRNEKEILQDVLTNIQSLTTSKFNKALATHLIDWLKDKDISLKFVKSDRNTYKDGIIRYDLDGVSNNGIANILLHEIIHGLTEDVLDNPVTPEQKKAVTRINGFINELKQKAGVKQEDIDRVLNDVRTGKELKSIYDLFLYGVSSPKELVALTMENEDFLNEVGKYEYFNTGKSFLEELWNRFIDLLKSFGIISDSLSDTKALLISDIVSILSPYIRKNYISDNDINAPTELFRPRINIYKDDVASQKALKLAENYLARIDDLDNKIRALQYKQQDEGYDKDRQGEIIQLREKVNQLEDEVNKITKNITDLSTLSTYYERDLEELDRLFSDKMTIEDLIYARKITDTWMYIDFFTEEEKRGNETLVRLFQDIRNKFEPYEDEIVKLTNQWLVENINKDVFGNVENIEDVFLNFKDKNTIFAETIAVGRSGNTLAALASKYIRLAEIRSNYEYDQLTSKVSSLINKARQILNDDFSIFEQRYSNNSNLRTGNITMYFTQEYVDTRRKLYYNAIKEGTPDAWKKFFNWKKENEISYNFNMFFPNESPFKDKPSNEAIAKHKAEILKHLGSQKLYDKQIKNLEKKKAQWDEEIELYRESLVNNYPDLTEDEINTKVHDYELKWSPYYYSKAIENPNTHYLDSNKEKVYNSGWSNTVFIPRRYKIRNQTQTVTNWYDSNFDRIVQNDTLFELHDEIINIISELNRYLSPKDRYKLQVNSLSFITKEIIGMFSDEGGRGGYNGLVDGIKETLSANDQGTINYGYQNPRTKEVEKKLYNNLIANQEGKIIAIIEQKKIDYFNEYLKKPTQVEINRFRREATEQIVANRGTSLEEVLKAYIKLATSYKYKSRIEDHLRIINNVIHDAVEPKRTNSGELQSKPTGEVDYKSQSDSFKVFKEMWKYRYDSFYGKTFKDQGKVDSKKYTDSEKEQRKIIRDELLKVDTLLRSTELDFKEGRIDDTTYNRTISSLMDKRTDLKAELENLGSEKKIYTSAEKVELAKLTKSLNDINKRLTDNEVNYNNGNLTEEEYSSIKKILSDNKDNLLNQISKLGKYQYWSGRFLLFLKVAHLKGLGWNMFSPFTNMTYGTVANYTEAADGRWIDPKSLSRGYSKVLNSFVSGITLGTVDTIEAKKIRNLMYKFRVLSDATDPIGKRGKTKFNGILKYATPYAGTEMTEYINQGAPFIGMMHMDKYKVKDLNGKEHLYYKAFDENGNWKEAEFGKEDKKFREEFNMKVHEFIDMTHGDYREPHKISETAIKQAFKMYRTWMFEGILNKFGTEKPSPLTGEIVKGRYITLFDVVRGYTNKETGVHYSGVDNLLFTLKQIMKKLAFGAFGKTSFDDRLSEVDAANMRKNVNELIILSSILMIIMLLKGIVSDDDDDKSQQDWLVMNYLINSGLRLQSDMLFYTSPREFIKLNKNIMPATTVITDTGEWIRAIGKFIAGNDEIRTGIYAGDSRLARETMQMFPFTTQFPRIKGVVSQVQNQGYK